MTEGRTQLAELLSGYEVGLQLGEGASGVVFEGRHRDLGRQVAIKQLRSVFGDDRGVRARFVREARVLASLDHPHIVPVYDFVQRDGVCLLVMELLTGGTVWSRFTGRGLSADEACAVVLATCDALRFAHEHGVLHRDIKPDNLLFAATGVLKVTDFGIAKVLGGAETLATRAGDVLGTPAYMAPEQALAGEPSPATDVYATGVMLYELLSANLPFGREGGPLAVIYRHVNERPTPLLDVAPAVPPPIAAVVMQAIETEPEARYASAEAMRVALAQATAEAWGTDWLSRSRARLMGTPDSSQTTIAPTEADATLGEGATLRPSEVVTVSTSGVDRSHQTWVGVSSEIELVPVRQLLGPASFSPTSLILAAVGLLWLMAAIAIMGLASPQRGGSLLAGMVTVGGVDPGRGSPLRLDLATPVVIAGRVPPGLQEVRLGFSVLGIPLGSEHAEARQKEDGSFETQVDATRVRFLGAGKTTARIELLFAGQDGVAFQLTRTFTDTSRQPSLLTVPGAAGVAFLLFVLGYAESFLRCVRHGSRIVLGLAGLVALGLLAGLVALDLAWAGGGREPVLATLLVCAALGALSGLAGGRAALLIHRRKEARRRLAA